MQESPSNNTLSLIKQLIRSATYNHNHTPQQHDLELQSLIQQHIVHLINNQHNILHPIKDALTDPELSNPNKYIILMYISLLDVDHSKIIDLSRFYYELTSHAIKEIKEGKRQSDVFWQNICEKIYQYGMLLLVGSRSLLLNIENIGTRVNSQLFALKSKQMRLSRLVKIYNCVLCIPQKYLTLKQTLYFTLIFTRWEVKEQIDQNKSFFSIFMNKTQKKLIKKLKQYSCKCFNQQHILNLIKIILGGDQLVFSYFLQIKYTYQALKDKNNSNIKAERSVFDSIRKCIVVRQNRHLFNFLIQLLISLNDESVLKSVERQSILFVCLKWLSGKFQNNQQLFVILVRHILQEQNPIISQISFRYIREEALQFLTVHKVKLLLNVFNIQNWNQIKTGILKQQHIFDRIQKTISLLGAVGRRYSENSLFLYCQPDQYCLSIKNAKNIRSLVFVASFDGIGRLSQNQKLTMKLIRFQIHKEIFQVIIEFRESLQSYKFQLNNQSKERSANLIIRNNGTDLVNERVQYLRFGEGSFQSLITVSYVGKNENTLVMCIDGANYEFPCKKKVQIINLEIGSIAGTIHSFYALKCQVELIHFYKTWSEWNRKTKFVVYNLGTQNIVYKLNNRSQSAIVDCNQIPTFSFFSFKTQIFLMGTATAKQITFIDILLQLGGLETIFFILQKFSRGLISFKRNEQKLNFLMADFFNCIKSIATLDESNIFLDDISNCFKYLNEFLFLMIKRNKRVSQSHNSNLMLSIFQMLVYFRFWKFQQKVPLAMVQKMIKVQTNLVLQTLVNFQIWSNCSISLQLFVMTRIQHYIKQPIYTNIFIKKNLLKHLLSSLMLFQVSPDHISHYEQLQQRTIELCIGLYKQSKLQYLSIFEKDSQNPQSESYQSFLQRDQITCMTFIQFLLKNARSKHLSPSQKKAFQVITKFIIDILVNNKSYLHIIGYDWNSAANILCENMKYMKFIDIQILIHSVYLIIAITSHLQHYDLWIFRFTQNLLNNQSVTFITCFTFLQKMINRYRFQTQRKKIILKSFIFKLSIKAQQGVSLSDIQQFKEIIKSMSIIQIYNITLESQFYSLMVTIKKNWFKNLFKIQSLNELKKLRQMRKQNNVTSQESNIDHIDNQVKNLQKLRAIWMQINDSILQALYEGKKINNLNIQFTLMLINNLYEMNLNQKYALMPLNQIVLHLQTIRQMTKKSHLNTENRYYKHGILSAFALIQHCSCWLVMYFLMDNGLLTLQKDIKIPFVANEMPDSIGGTVGYYLSKKPSPIQLFVILVMIHGQLSNNLTILSVQSSLAIFQYSLQYLNQNIKPNNLNQTIIDPKNINNNATILIIIFKEVLKSLNNSFINKCATIVKQLDKLLQLNVNPKIEATNWKKLKSNEIIQNLSKASFKIQDALQDSRIDKDMAFFIEQITSRLSPITFKKNSDAIDIFYSIVELLNKDKSTSISSQLQLKKLKVSGIRFFEISRQYFLSINQEIVYSKTPEVKKNIKSPEINSKQMQYYANYMTSLIENFDSILQFYYSRDKTSEEIWGNLLISNQYWFQLQGDIDDVTTKFYELDQKQIGPFGLYKLNIRPLKHDHQKLPYPRKKEYLEMRSKKEEQKKQKQMPIQSQRSTIIFTASTIYSTLSESVVAKEKLLGTIKSSDKIIKNKKVKQYFCEYVTKKGIYAGTITKKKNHIQFNFTGSDKLPLDRVYQTSTNKCHKIQILNEWQERQIKVLKIPFNNLTVLTRRYIMRHTAFEIFHAGKHRSYFFNLFYNNLLNDFISQLKQSNEEIIDDRRQYFEKAQFTQQWRKGLISNFQYLSLINRFSGRSLNDLVQYHVFPWVITNYEGHNGWKQFDKEFMKCEQNMRNLSFPTGKLNSQKFNKLKARLREVDASDRQIRFLYGTMYSNPTVLYNFFIRLEPYTSLHWEHQGRKLDHADRLFSGVAEQFRTIITSSSDMKQLTPQFYYWTEFLRNRNKIELGTKQKGEQVDSVVLPIWARTPQQFIFKMREALQSNYVSLHLHEWIDLIFGYKSPYDAAEEHDNLYHYQCYQHDLFQCYQTENQMKIAQITISEFGQIPQQLFFNPHPTRYIRQQMNIDRGTIVIKCKNAVSFQYNEAGIMIWNKQKVIFKKAAINELYSSFDWTKQYDSKSQKCILMGINMLKWMQLQAGTLKLLQKGKIRMNKSIQSKCIDIMSNYIFFGLGSKIVIIKINAEMFQMCASLYGHRDEIILIKVNFILDIIISVDKNGYVLIHQLTDLRFLRAFQLGINFQSDQYQKLKLCIHHMGYFIFFDQLQTLRVFNFMGQMLLDQDIQIKDHDNKEDEEKITDIHIFSHEHSQIVSSLFMKMLSSTKGNIFMVNFLQLIRFREVYPYKTFSRLGRNILANARSKHLDQIENKEIITFSLAKTVGERNIIYQILVLYKSGEFVVYSEQKQVFSQLQYNPRLKSMGIF